MLNTAVTPISRIGVIAAIATLGCCLALPATGETIPSSDVRGPGSGANLVRDADFEPPGLDEMGSFQTYNPDWQDELGSWTITSGSIDLVGPNADPAATGAQFVDLNGNDDVGPGIITQSLDLTADRSYRVRFALAGNRNGEPLIKDLTVSLGATSHDFRFDATEAVESDALEWGYREFTAEACSGGAANLTFTSKTEGIRGPLIDDVSVVDAGAASACGAASSLWKVVLLGALGIVWLVAVARWARALMRQRALRAQPA